MRMAMVNKDLYQTHGYVSVYQTIGQSNRLRDKSFHGLLLETSISNTISFRVGKGKWGVSCPQTERRKLLARWPASGTAEGDVSNFTGMQFEDLNVKPMSHVGLLER